MFLFFLADHMEFTRGIEILRDQNCNTFILYNLPCTLKFAVAVDGLLLVTLYWYCPPSLSVTVRVWVYCAVTILLSTVIPSETVLESLVHVTVVAGPPVEIQVRIN